MAIQPRGLEALQPISVLAPTTVSTNNNTTAVDLSSLDGDALIILRHGTSSTGTINAKIQHGDQSNGSDAADVPGGAFTQLGTTAGVQKIAIPRDGLKKFFRIAFTGLASSYSATVDVMAVGTKKYMD